MDKSGSGDGVCCGNTGSGDGFFFFIDAHVASGSVLAAGGVRTGVVDVGFVPSRACACIKLIRGADRTGDRRSVVCIDLGVDNALRCVERTGVWRGAADRGVLTAADGSSIPSSSII